MAKIKITAPPKGLKNYLDYLPWLKENFFRDFCAYCFITQTSLQVDHHEPQKMSPNKINNPGNLLPICSACNSRGGKSDYHHKNQKRTKGKDLKFQVINIRKDDFAKLFNISSTGEITPKPGRNHERSLQNIILLKLDRPTLTNYRKRYIDYLEALTLLSSQMRGRGKSAQQAKAAFNKLLPHLVDTALFFYVYDLKLNRVVQRATKGFKKAACIPK